LSEKEQIEYATAIGFLALYNPEFGTDYSITEHGDSPDIRCFDSAGNGLNLEITMTEDWSGDIQANLGRSNQRDIDMVHLLPTNCLNAEVLDHAYTRIHRKLNKDYGSSVALVLRDTSGADWDWDMVADELKTRLEMNRIPFDKGIWIINNWKSRMFRIT
jgi:hypothetical protein